jgi:hypothetical protein
MSPVLQTALPLETCVERLRAAIDDHRLNLLEPIEGNIRGSQFELSRIFESGALTGSLKAKDQGTQIYCYYTPDRLSEASVSFRRLIVLLLIAITLGLGLCILYTTGLSHWRALAAFLFFALILSGYFYLDRWLTKRIWEGHETYWVERMEKLLDAHQIEL